MFDQIPIRRVIGAFGVVLAGLVWAQGEGAPSLQQAQAECSSIAQQQTGSNPNAAATTAPSQPQAGGRARGAAAGAMAGAAKGKSKANQYGNVPDEVAEEYTRNQAQDGRHGRRGTPAERAGSRPTASRLRQRLVNQGSRMAEGSSGRKVAGGTTECLISFRTHSSWLKFSRMRWPPRFS